MSKEDPKLFETRLSLKTGEYLYGTHVTLRDLFAASALAGILANPHGDNHVAGAFEYADKMLAARAPVKDNTNGGSDEQ